MEQTRRPDARYQIGKGKVEELAKLVEETGAEKVIFDNSLRTLQNYNLAKATHVEVIDRFQLILELFNKRATTTEAQLQIQLATLQNELKHAREKVRLSKGSEQPGFMGLGAYEADVYKDAINTAKRHGDNDVAKVFDQTRDAETEHGNLQAAALQNLSSMKESKDYYVCEECGYTMEISMSRCPSCQHNAHLLPVK
jgi:50S ribosomal subunit-associated GTPase HflX